MDKNTLRKSVLAARDALSSYERAEKSAEICRMISESEYFIRAGTVLSYYPIGSEVDVRPLNALCISSGKRLLLPVSRPGGIMEAYPAAGELKPGMFSVPEPDTKALSSVPPEETELVIVPCIAFDAALHRLGHGGGYYDRYLPRCINAHTVCVAFDCQRLPLLPADSLDFSPDAAVTESGIILSPLVRDGKRR